MYDELRTIGRAACIALLCAGAAGCDGMDTETIKGNVMYAYKVNTEPTTGWHIVTLSAEHPDDPDRSLSVSITPEGGNNMYSFSVGGRELLVGPTSFDTFFDRIPGTPILYPTPNRVRDAVYEFMGESYTMSFPGEKQSHWIHGLVRDDTAWEFDEPSVTSKGVYFTARYTMNEDNPRFVAYPFPNVLTVTYRLMADRVRIYYEVKNIGTTPLGFGFALHPFFQVHGGKENTTIQVGAPTHMIATDDHLPTGEVEPVDGTSFDLREPRKLSDLKLDDVYLGVGPDIPLRFTFESLGLGVRLVPTEDFSHVVVYTPNSDFFCIENQTCSTDAHNLHSRGLVDEAHLQIVKPGRKSGGHVDYVVEFGADE
jgi:aldose 1-epimerase